MYFNIASFDVDAEKCFTPLCPNELPVPDAHNIVKELNCQAEYARIRVGSKDAHTPSSLWVTTNPAEIATPVDEDKKGPNIDLKWPLHGVPGTVGFELLDGLPDPEDYDFFVWKGIEVNLHPYGACYHGIEEKLSTGVIEFLKQNSITTVIVGGIATDYCAGTTAKQLLKAGFRVIFNLGACRGISPDGINKMLNDIKLMRGEIINSHVELNKALYDSTV